MVPHLNIGEARVPMTSLDRCCILMLQASLRRFGGPFIPCDFRLPTQHVRCDCSERLQLKLKAQFLKPCKWTCGCTGEVLSAERSRALIYLVAFDHARHLGMCSLGDSPGSEDYEHAMEQLKKAGSLAFVRLEAFQFAAKNRFDFGQCAPSEFRPCACSLVQGSIHGHNTQRQALKAQASYSLMTCKERSVAAKSMSMCRLKHTCCAGSCWGLVS